MTIEPSKSEIGIIANCAEVVASKIKPTHGACLYASAALAVILAEEKIVGVKFLTGSLSVNGKQLFQYTPIKKYLTSGNSVPEIWDGHAWVSVGNVIVDMSVFQTIYTSEKEELHDLFNGLFGGYKAYLLGQEHRLEQLGMSYTASDELSSKEAGTLLVSGAKLGIIGS